MWGPDRRHQPEPIVVDTERADDPVVGDRVFGMERARCRHGSPDAAGQGGSRQGPAPLAVRRRPAEVRSARSAIAASGALVESLGIVSRPGPAENPSIHHSFIIRTARGAGGKEEGGLTSGTIAFLRPGQPVAINQE